MFGYEWLWILQITWGRHPPVGVWIAFLGFLGVFVTLVRDAATMGKREKAIWILVVFALLLLEIKSVYQDRAEHDEQQRLAREAEDQNFKAIAGGIKKTIENSDNQFAQTMEKTQGILATAESVADMTRKNLLNITGGSSFPYISPQVWGAPDSPVGLVVWNHGGEILSGVTVSISHTSDPNWGDEFMQHYIVGTLGAHDMYMLPVVLSPQLRPDGTDHYWMQISAQNGTVDESVFFRRALKNSRQWAVRFLVTSRLEVNDHTTKFPVLMNRDWSDEGGKDLLKNLPPKLRKR